MTEPATGALRTRAEAVPAGQARREGGARPARPARRAAHLRRLPDHLRLDPDAESAERVGHRGAAAGVLRGAGLGLLGAQPRPRPVQGPLALGRGAGQNRPDHRRVLGDRQSDRGQGRRRRRHGAAGRPLARQAGGDQGGDRRRRRHRPHPPVRPRRHRGHRADGRGGADLPRPRRHPRQQRRPLDPPLDRALLRPLPRLRAHDPAQLPRRGAADPGADAGDAGAQAAATSSTSARSGPRPTRRASRPTSPPRPRSTPSAG